MNVVYFDGVCNLCNGVVNFLIDQDPKKVLRFASLQSPAGQEVLLRFGLSVRDYDSFLLLKEDKLLLKSDAVLEIIRLLGGVWGLLYAFKVLPRTWRDGLYSLIARNRYRWFGKRTECRLPTPDLKARFL
jgi:predicted DCC family thiol-disulfide oxidoreductase YuxK